MFIKMAARAKVTFVQSGIYDGVELKEIAPSPTIVYFKILFLFSLKEKLSAVFLCKHCCLLVYTVTKAGQS